MELLEELGAVGVGILLAISVAGLFWKLDDAIAERPRNALSRLLQRLSIEPPHPNLPAIVAAAFDRIFGEKHFSKRCFFMSCLFSILAVAALTAIYLQVNDYWARRFWAFRMSGEELAVFALMTFGFNLIPDYLSLLETRVIVGAMSRTRKASALVGYLFMDLILTYVIFITLSGFFWIIAVIYWNSMQLELSFVVQHYADYFTIILSEKPLAFVGDASFLAIFLYSTYFTSVWVWLTALGWWAIRVMAKAPPLLKAMQYLLPIDERPLRSIGEVAAVIVCLCYWSVTAITQFTVTP